MSQAETPNLLSTITRQAVSEALSEFEVLGRTAFLARYGFGPARECFVKHPITDRLCDARAVVGAAYGYQFSMAGPLTDNTLAGGDATVAALLKRLGFEVVSGAPVDSKPPEAGRDWSTLEAELLVADYLQMLTLELNGQTFNKAARRRALLPLLNGRTEASIEFKRRNVSAIMGRLGFPCLRGYLPAENAQDKLVRIVLEQMEKMPVLGAAAEAAVSRPAVPAEPMNFDSTAVAVPVRKLRTAEPRPSYQRVPVKRDYLELETRNRSLGRAGECFIVDYERWRLLRLGLGQLAERVEHKADTEGDGLGYDVLSFEPDGRERLIEVKTTAFNETTPFYISCNEVRLAREEPDKFKLCRVFDFRVTPRFFELAGPVEQHCHLDPTTFRASLS
jgi:hypothetical protein